MYSEIEELRDRLDMIESSASGGGDSGAIFLYFFGTLLAMILSWARNASILYCIGHGLTSWIYVIYFAATR